jgi:serine protease
MERDCDCKIKLCPDTNPPRPINLAPDPPPDDSGFLIIRFKPGALGSRQAKLAAAAKQSGLRALSDILDEYKLASQPLVTSLNRAKLEKLEQEAMQGDTPPMRSLTSYWRLDTRQVGAKLQEIEVALRRIPEIELVYREKTPSDPVNAGNDTYSGSESFLDAAPTGVDARWVWTQPNGDGTGMRFIDLEQGWLLGHEDLPSPTLIFNDNHDGTGGYVGNHGAAVLGEVAGVDNTRGIIGLAPNVASVRTVSWWKASDPGTLHVADALLAAVGANPRPHVVLIEVQIGSALLPVETDPANLDAIRLAVASGVVVVEAGGNGNNDLDAWTDSLGKQRLNRSSADFVDSGATLVGAALSALPHDRASFSNYGSRVDCYAWGENIVSAGYGDLAGSGNTSYTATFGGTSGASPIITGAALLMQGLYLASAGTTLSPPQVRQILSNPVTGTAQGTGVAGNIGVMPNLRAIVQNTLGLVPDVYLRDAIGDTGVVPSTGNVSVSPDVITQPVAVADPNASFGEGSGTENNDTLGTQVEHGQDNFVYIRMRNRGMGVGNGTTAKVYWSEVSTLVTPEMWHLIGTTSPVNVPVGDTLVVAGPLIWHKADLPASGDHACFVAILDQASDPAPPIPASGPGFDWNAFVNLVRSHNNITWRNFNVVDVLPDPSADPAVLDFLIAGSPDAARQFDLEVIQRMPQRARVELEVPLALLAVMPKTGFVSRKVDRRTGRARLMLPSTRGLPLCSVRLSAGARHRCRLLVHGDPGLAGGLHRIAVRQIFDGIEVGRVTFGLRVKR